MNHPQYALEALESRTLMSAGPASAVFNPTVLADRLQVKVDLLTFKSHALGAFATLLSDEAALKHDHLADATTVVPLVQKLNADIRQMRQTLRIDRLNESAAVLADRAVIVADLRQILLDRADAAAVATDRDKLRADRVQLQQDLVAGLTARLDARQAAADTISADAQAIVTAVQSDPNASDQLKADLTKLVNDQTARFTTLSADLQKLLADRQKLVDDLTASQSS
jgi:hypothetical protein